MSMNKKKESTWFVKLTATDGRVCHWRFDNHSLARVHDLVRCYVESCPYDCDWTIIGNDMKIEGQSRQKHA